MELLKAWSLIRVASLCGAWLVLSFALAAYPYVRAMRELQARPDYEGVGAITVSVSWLLFCFVVIVLPPLVFSIAWLRARSS
jgi:hypothetical protein